jgi:hypothetical protein
MQGSLAGALAGAAAPKGDCPSSGSQSDAARCRGLAAAWGAGPRLGAGLPRDAGAACLARRRARAASDVSPAALRFSRYDLQWHELHRRSLVEGTLRKEELVCVPQMLQPRACSRERGGAGQGRLEPVRQLQGGTAGRARRVPA